MPAPRTNRKEVVFVRIPEELNIQLRTLLADPRSGKVRYGALSALIIRCLRDWIEHQRVALDPKV